ncbi:hypothetical protein PENTCL1PPCAC_25440, partial [Pristionchus entomophagus]
ALKMPSMPSVSSPASFFTLPFRRKKQRYTINQPDEPHTVIYLGNVLTVLAKGEDCVEKPLSLIWKAYCGRQRPDLNMRLEVTHSGLKAETKTQGVTEYYAHRITYCAAPEQYPRLFCWVYKHEGKRLRPELRCHAILCKKKGEAAALQESLTNSLHQALQEYRREKMAHQKARASSLTGTCPRRKLMLQTGSLHFRPPVSRSRSAPRLGSIDEVHEEDEENASDADSVCYREEPLGDTMSTASSSYAGSDGTSPPSSVHGGTKSANGRLEDRRFCRSVSSEPDSVSEESGYGDDSNDNASAPATQTSVICSRRDRFMHSDSLMYSDEELIILEEELDDLTVTSL